ncbi:DinB superfamily protein [compost metagenome]
MNKKRGKPMNTTQSLQRLEELTHTYLEELQFITSEQVNASPNEAEWSLGQMYQHLINSALYMQISNINICLNQDQNHNLDENNIGVKTDIGNQVFALGGFPPIRIHVPASSQYTPVNPESKEQLIEGMNRVLIKMKEIEPRLQQFPSMNTVRHPRLGSLNAVEWFSLVEMHYRHHLHQRDRLYEFLNISL